MNRYKDKGREIERQIEKQKDRGIEIERRRNKMKRDKFLPL